MAEVKSILSELASLAAYLVWWGAALLSVKNGESGSTLFGFERRPRSWLGMLRKRLKVLPSSLKRKR